MPRSFLAIPGPLLSGPVRTTTLGGFRALVPPHPPLPPHELGWPPAGPPCTPLPDRRSRTMIRRNRTTTSPVIVRDLVILTTVDQDEVELPGLTVQASDDGVTVLGPADQVLRSWTWSE